MQYAATKVIGINATIVLAVAHFDRSRPNLCVTLLQQTASNRLAVSTILFGSNLNRTKIELFILYHELNINHTMHDVDQFHCSQLNDL